MDATNAKAHKRTEILLVVAALMLAPVLDGWIGAALNPAAGGLSFGSILTRLCLAALVLHLAGAERSWFTLAWPDLLRAGLALAALLTLAWFAGQIPVAAAPMPQAVWPALVLLSVSSAAFYEECLYRTWFMEGCRSLDWATAPTLFVQAGLFALGHFYQGPIAGLLALVAGLLLGWLWQSRRKLWINILAHGVYNLVLGLVYTGIITLPS